MTKLILPRLMVLSDLLLAVSAALFLLPLDARLSNTPLVLWLLIQCAFAPSERRWLMWPIFFALSLSVRTLSFNDPPHPASAHDAWLFASGLIIACAIPFYRWRYLLYLPLIAMVPVLITLGQKPWAPNPSVGSNQGAYLLGMFFLISFFGLWDTGKRRMIRIVLLLASVGTFLAVWQTSSRAALVSAAVAIVFVAVRERSRFSRRFWYEILFAVIFAVAGYLIRWKFFSANQSLPGLKSGSDLGRLLASQCFASLPLTGNNRLIYGVGFERSDQLCQVPFQGLILSHSHNLYIQIWSAAGLLGLLGLTLLITLVIKQWSSVESHAPRWFALTGQAVLIYVICQGFFDLSMVHWPLTILYSSLLLAMPWSLALTSTEMLNRR